MKNTDITHLDATTCRSALNAFWNHICEIEPYDKGLVFSLPVLLSDGWQVVIYASEEVPGYLTLRDRGKMYSWLSMRDINIDSEQNQQIINHELQQYGVMIDEHGFYKTIRLPMAAKEIQLFACFLSSISHLTYRLIQKQNNSRRASYNTVIDIAEYLQFPYKTRHIYRTAHRQLAVDLTIIGQKKNALVKTFDQKGRTATDSMELWSARLPEIVATNPELYVPTLVYNEDTCEITSDVISVAKSRGNYVFPSHRSDELSDYLSQLA